MRSEFGIIASTGLCTGHTDREKVCGRQGGGLLHRDSDASGPSEFGRRDMFFLAALFLLGVALSFGIYHFSESGSEIRIFVDGELVGVYDLQEDQEISIEPQGGGVNVVAIENGAAYMKSADCPDALCMHQGKVSRDKQTIVCLPHKLVVEVVGGKAQEYDSISR